MVKEYFMLMFQNKVLDTAIICWAVAQVLKFLINCFINKKIDITKLWSDGGMPSCHSSTVTGLAMMTGFTEGFRSTYFAIACVFAFIVMHDAMGVRLETGKQAVLINDIIAFIQDTNPAKWSRDASEKRLKEFVGHTPTQVIAGFLVGLTCTLILYNIGF